MIDTMWKMRFGPCNTQCIDGCTRHVYMMYKTGPQPQLYRKTRRLAYDTIYMRNIFNRQSPMSLLFPFGSHLAHLTVFMSGGDKAREVKCGRRRGRVEHGGQTGLLGT